jgi:hypothetical protein
MNRCMWLLYKHLVWSDLGCHGWRDCAQGNILPCAYPTSKQLPLKTYTSTFRKECCPCSDGLKLLWLVYGWCRQGDYFTYHRHVVQFLLCDDKGICFYITDMLFSFWCVVTGEFVPFTMAYCSAPDVWWQGCWFQLEWHILQLLMCDNKGVCFSCNGILFSFWCLMAVCLFHCIGILFSFWCVTREAVISIVTFGFWFVMREPFVPIAVMFGFWYCAR